MVKGSSWIHKVPGSSPVMNHCLEVTSSHSIHRLYVLISVVCATRLSGKVRMSASSTVM